MKLSWTTVANTADKVSKDWCYGLGWAILPEKHECGCGKDQQKAIAHSGKLVLSRSKWKLCMHIGLLLNKFDLILTGRQYA